MPGVIEINKITGLNFFNQFIERIYNAGVRGLLIEENNKILIKKPKRL